MKKKLKPKQILPEYTSAIKTALEKADTLFPEATLVIKKIEVGNAGLHGEPDGTRLGRCQHRKDGLHEIYLSQKILSESYPPEEMKEAIVSAIIHEYAHTSQTIYAYNSDPLRMYLSLLISDQLELELGYMQDFYTKHKDNVFTKYIEFKRRGDYFSSELIPEAYESVYLDDYYSEYARDIVADYQEVLNKKPVIPFRFFTSLLHIRNAIVTLLLALFLSFFGLIFVSIMRSLLVFITSKILI